MKKYLLVVTIAIAFSVGCKDREVEKQIAQLHQDKDSLIRIADSKDSSLNLFVNSFNEIESNLEEVKKHQDIITLNSKDKSEGSRDVKARIQEDIGMINNLMDENKKKLAYLDEKMKQADYKIGSFDKLVATLKSQINSKDSELADLNKQLVAVNEHVNQLNVNVADLTETSKKQATTIDDQTNKLNTAYYAVGTYKQLKTKNVLEKEGGIVGLGSSEKLKSDFNQEYFTKVDITKVQNIPLNTKKAELITAHPSGSYEFEKNEKKVITNLIITDPEKFWEASKYLIVMTD